MLVYLQGEGKTNMKSYKPVIDYYQKKHNAEEWVWDNAERI